MDREIDGWQETNRRNKWINLSVLSRGHLGNHRDCVGTGLNLFYIYEWDEEFVIWFE